MQIQNNSADTDESKKKSSDDPVLKAKGIYDYFQNIDEKILSKRVCMGNKKNLYVDKVIYIKGWLDKRSKGKLKYYQKRWWILISAKPIVSMHYI